MSNVIPHTINQLVTGEFTKEQVELIRATVAKGATNDELKLFLYRCKNMGLDPLKPGQVHFIKYGSNPGTIVIGLDGFRVKAARTGRLVGTKRGVIKDSAGKVIAGWCEVFRSDWSHPAREEAPLAEYDTHKGNWQRMPETMIKKVAEVAALRMAFPDDLGGMYSEEEIEREEVRQMRPREVQARLDAEIDVGDDAPAFEAASYFDASQAVPDGPGEYLIKVGKNRGKQIKELSQKDIENFVKFYNEKQAAGENMHIDVREYYEKICAFQTLPEVP